MMTHLHSTSVLVGDQDQALAFYVDTLGWEKRTDQRFGPDYRFLTVAPPGAATEVVLQVGSGEHPAPLVIDEMGGTGISVLTDDIAGDYAALTAQGVEFTQAPETMPWGDAATWFLDPFGNKYFLVQASAPAG